MIAHKRGIEHLDTELLEDLLTGFRIAFMGVARDGVEICMLVRGGCSGVCSRVWVPYVLQVQVVMVIVAT